MLRFQLVQYNYIVISILVRYFYYNQIKNQKYHRSMQNFQGFQFNFSQNQNKGYFKPSQQYKIMSAMGHNLCLDISQGNNYGQLMIWQYKKSLKQHFRLNHHSNNMYQIVNSQTGQPISVIDGSNENGALIFSTKIRKNQSHLFKIQPGNEKNAYFIWTHAGKTLDVYGGQSNYGTIVHQWDKNGNLNQQWRFEEVESNWYMNNFNNHNNFNKNNHRITPHRQYIIHTAISDNLVVDISANLLNFGHLLVWNQHRGNNQKFVFNQYNGKYQIVNPHDKTVLTVKNNSNQNGAKIIATKPVGSSYQWFTLEPANNKNKNSWYIITYAGKCLDLYGGQNKKGTIIHQWDRNNNLNQIWNLELAHDIIIPHKEYIIHSALGNKLVIDISANLLNFGHLLVWQQHQGNNQRFLFHQYNGKYQIINPHGKTVLTVKDNSNENGAKIIAAKPNGSPYQWFTLEPAQNRNKNSWYIMTHAGKYLDVFGSNNKKGTIIHQWDKNVNQNQIWDLFII